MKFKTAFTFLILGFILISCNQSPQKPVSLKYKRISLTAYSYLKNDSVPNRRDFYVSSFWQIDSMGKCEMIRRDGFKKDQKYFEDNLPDSTVQLINSLDFSKLDTIQLLPVRSGHFDGVMFCMAIYTKDGKENQYIKFIPSALDEEFLKLYNSLSKTMAEASTVGMFPASYYQNINYIRKNLSDSTKYPFPVGLKGI